MTDRIGPYELGRVHHADCLDAMRRLPDGCVQCCITSPPYWGLRKYDVPDSDWLDGWRGQLGLEPTPDLYVAHMVAVFREVRRVLRGDGTCWLNIGDGYSAAVYSNHKGTGGALRSDGGKQHHTRTPDGLKPKDLIGIPWLLAFALRADGWFLRAEIIWHKTAPMPESVRDRPTRAHEQVFLLSKSGTYFYDHEAASDPATYAGTTCVAGDGRRAQKVDGGKPHGNSVPGTVIKIADRRNWRTVWTIGPEPNNAQHYAPFPRELARRCVVAGSRVGDVVLDPFAGTGTTVRVADGLQRRAIGFDLGAGYVAQANERSGNVRPADATVGQQAGLFAEVPE